MHKLIGGSKLIQIYFTLTLNQNSPIQSTDPRSSWLSAVSQSTSLYVDSSSMSYWNNPVDWRHDPVDWNFVPPLSFSKSSRFLWYSVDWTFHRIVMASFLKLLILQLLPPTTTNVQILEGFKYSSFLSSKDRLNNLNPFIFITYSFSNKLLSPSCWVT